MRRAVREVRPRFWWNYLTGDPLSCEEPQEILRLFFYMGKFYDFRIADDRQLVTRVLSNCL